jgi:hypothetical protein
VLSKGVAAQHVPRLGSQGAAGILHHLEEDDRHVLYH